jgi:hypothetical protein
MRLYTRLPVLPMDGSAGWSIRKIRIRVHPVKLKILVFYLMAYTGDLFSGEPVEMAYMAHTPSTAPAIHIPLPTAHQSTYRLRLANL